jgi:hypothetical protein
MPRALRSHLSYANVVASIALFAALGGGAYAAVSLPKNSVGSKQLKKNAVTGKKVKNHSLTGAELKVSSLPKVPAAASADHASTADQATTAGTASDLTPPEQWHEVGAPGETPFAPGASNAISPAPDMVNFETVAFYKDREAVVHLKGMATPGTGSEILFLPAGYRPRAGRVIELIASCRSPCTSPITVQILGGGFGAADDGKVVAPSGPVSLDGLTFRAGS